MVTTGVEGCLSISLFRSIILSIKLSLYKQCLWVSAGVGLHAVKTIKSNKGSEVGGRALWIYDQELKKIMGYDKRKCIVFFEI